VQEDPSRGAPDERPAAPQGTHPCFFLRTMIADNFGPSLTSYRASSTPASAERNTARPASNSSGPAAVSTGCSRW
jgi:hypothetical protein